MIPGPFEYHRPASAAEAAGLMSQLGDEARLLAGGHSLIPMMKLRMTDLSHLIDLQDIDAMKGIVVSASSVTLGALVTQHELIASTELAEVLPIIREAALQIADPQVRYVGTIGGNVANGDPGNDLPGLMQCLDASYEMEGANGVRQVAARDFYESAYFTAREEDEILTRIQIPLTGSAYGYAYEKQKRKIGDYATAAAAVVISMTGGKVASASIAMTNLADTPIWSAAAGAALVGTDASNDARAAAVAAALGAIDPVADGRGPVEFKMHVAGIILRRAIDRAISRAA